MTNRILAKRYAKALIILGKEEDSYKEFGQVLSEFTELLSANEPLNDALTNDERCT